MQDTGERYSITIVKNGISIVENLSGKQAVYQGKGFLSFDIDSDSILSKLKSIQEAMLTYKKRKLPQIFKKPAEGVDKITIVEKGHYHWEIEVGKYKATIKDNKILAHAGFKQDFFLKQLNHVIAAIYNYKRPRKPRYDIVRRIADAGILVWVNGNDSLVVYERDVDGCTMADCLVNGDYYNILIVGASIEKGVATLANMDLEIIAEFPLDESVLEYYPDCTSMFD